MGDWESGSLLLFWGKEPISRAISFFTRGPSHVGVITSPRSRHPALLWEATTLCDLPDYLTNRPRIGFQCHVPEERIESYNGSVALLTLVDGEKLFKHEAEFLWQWLEHRHLENVKYNYPGALMSALLLRWTHLLPYPDMHSLFCSQICARALQRFGKVRRCNAGVFNPASLVREVRSSGVYSAPVTLKQAA